MGRQQLPPDEEEEEGWLSSSDVAALRAIKDSLTDIPGSNFLSTWDFSSRPRPCSTFAGITCYAGRVTVLALGTGLSGSPGLAGSLSPAISNLTELTQLVLYPGLVTGPIPPLLGRRLRLISLTSNRLTGPIPPSLSSLPLLHTLDLSHNQLTGSIPAPLWSALPQLRVLILSSNQLAGHLPAGDPRPQPQRQRQRQAQVLLHLDLGSNRLTGTLPLRMLPSSLRYLSVSNNNVWGPLNGLEGLSELVYLDLSMNRFSGPIPPSLFRPTLSSLFLQRNNLSGALFPSTTSSSSNIPYSYPQGSLLDLSHNSLAGPLPPLLAEVETLFLNNNRFTGAVPRQYVDSLYQGTTKTLYLHHNYLTGFPSYPQPGLPPSASLCLSYNCMLPLKAGLTACPASAGPHLSRPLSQCPVFNN
ncbi:hypothetical protein Tsubulata_051103 [Turnera subulata]|uniref:Leucine-rich repeat-containing N-terminal plant-type domain-containing protein n=1 Tax=Turnera subulata TaxID=218843 RepID=A0A9Q0FKH4_9ROSI|nr:hypothetical protein Tsubulata_051103 [Turnera subulata]